MAEKSFGVKEINLIGASGTPTIESPNNLNLNAVNVAISTNATIGGNLTVSGTVGIAGTLTYEDVTNVDAVGIITARDGIVIPDSKVLALGNRVSGSTLGDLRLYHNGNHSFIDEVGVGNLYIRNGSKNSIWCQTDGQVNLYYNDNAKLSTSNTGVSVSGTLAATAVTGDGSGLTGIAVTEAPVTDYTISANGSSAYRIHGGGVDETANNPDLYLIRGQKYRFNNTTGSNHPFQILVSNGGSEYGNGVSGDDEGVQFFTVPYDAPASLVYQCSIHGGMIGNIYIRGAAGNNTNVGLTTFISDVILNSGDLTVSHTGLAVNIFESTNNHSRLRIKSADASLAQLEFGDQSDADAGEIRYDHGNDRMTFHVGNNNEKVRILSNGRVLIGSGAISASSNLVGEGGLQVSTNGASGAPSVCIGADGTGANTQSLTDNTVKDCRIGYPNYDIDEEPIALISGFVGDGSSLDDNDGARVYIGGGTSYLNSANQIRFYTNNTSINTVTGTERLRITPDGKVVAGGTGVGYPCRLQSHGPGNLLDLNSTSGAAKILFYESGAGRFNIETLNGSSGLRFYDSLNAEERLRITSGGNIGINVTNPQSKLEVNGAITANGSFYQEDASTGGNDAQDKTITFNSRGVILVLISFSLGKTTTDFSRNIYSLGLFTPRSNGATWTAIQQDLNSTHVGNFTISDTGNIGALRVQKSAGTDSRNCAFRIDVLSSANVEITVTDT